MKVKNSPWGDRKELVNDRGQIVLESSILADKLLFVKGSITDAGRAGQYVTKEALEELLDVTILDKLPEVKPSSTADYHFHVDGYTFSDGPKGDTPARLLEIGLRYIAASKEIERRQAKSKAAKRLAEQKAHAEELAETRKRLQGVLAIKRVLIREGEYPSGTAATQAEMLYNAGIRATDDIEVEDEL